MACRFRFWMSYKSVRGKSYGAGIEAGNPVHVRGWDAGVEVVPKILTTDPTGRPQNRDVFDIYTTKGSNGGMGGRILLGRVAGTPEGPRFYPDAGLDKP